MEAPFNVWFGDESETQLAPPDMYLAVYAAGGGKRNMANFIQKRKEFHSGDVNVNIATTVAGSPAAAAVKSQLFICRFASNRGEWVMKPVPFWNGLSKLKLIPEWFKARFWDNKQEKKHPWFMFTLATVAANGSTELYPSNAFPVHQYYPTGPKKTDPNEAACRNAFHQVLKLSPATLLKPSVLAVTTSKKALAEAKQVTFPSMARAKSGGSSIRKGSSRKGSSSSSSGISSSGSGISSSISSSSSSRSIESSNSNSSSSSRGPSSQMTKEQDDHHHHLLFQRYRERPVSLSPVSSTGSESPTTSDDGDDGMDGMDVDGGASESELNRARAMYRRGALFHLHYSEDVGVPLKNIGADGMDAVQALLALRHL